ncbi:MAG: diguanylate cyclase [Candidatus Omnitrophica bacterium]|nr:diguanylate cyclase [Candidatus Omnitrophota bacterium]
MRVTLQSRITTIMLVFVVVLIGSFTLIQLQNQMKSITVFNSLKAKLAAQILKDSLQEALRSSNDEDPRKALGSALQSLRKAGLIESASVYSVDGVVAASTTRRGIGKRIPATETKRVERVVEGEGKGRGIRSFVDKARKMLQLYVPITTGNGVDYVGKLDMSLGNIGEALQQVYVPALFTAGLVVIANIVFGIILSKRVVGPISLLNEATKEMSGGDLSLRIHMETNDELEELADTFNVMAVELNKMKAKAENANPLTKLPGNIVIQEEAEQRIAEGKKFTVIYCDLDNFKAFNDKYGIHAGDDAITMTANLFREAVAQKGNPGDFLGHEGGDDFLLLTTPEKTDDVGGYITTEFDKRIRGLYDKDDLERGYIEAHARHGDEIIKFPIMTISLAGISNEYKPIESYAEITNIAASVKKKAKSTPGSCLIMDERKKPSPEAPEKKA